jgi:hypothetical protein
MLAIVPTCGNARLPVLAMLTLRFRRCGLLELCRAIPPVVRLILLVSSCAVDVEIPSFALLGLGLGCIGDRLDTCGVKEACEARREEAGVNAKDRAVLSNGVIFPPVPANEKESSTVCALRISRIAVDLKEIREVSLVVSMQCEQQSCDKGTYPKADGSTKSKFGNVRDGECERPLFASRTGDPGVDIAPVLSFCFISLILELSLLSFSWSARMRSYVDTLFLMSFEYMIAQIGDPNRKCVHAVSVCLNVLCKYASDL